jgi:hypothetical protein
VDAAAADLQVNVANGKETREFLGQSVGFENEIISQSMSPNGRHRNTDRAWPIPINPAGFAGRLGIRPSTAASLAGICRQRPILRKAESWTNPAAGDDLLSPLVEWRGWVEAVIELTAVRMAENIR